MSRSENVNSVKRKAFILGAGPAGLVTAWKLLEEGWDIEIFEKLNTVGGMCRSWKWSDFIVDTGPHIFHTPDENLASFWEKEFGDLFIKGEFWCKNVKGDNFDEYWDYPLSWESIAAFPIHIKQKVIDELEKRSSEGKARATSYRDYMQAEVGPTLMKMFFEKYPKKVWGIETSEMTPDWAPKRVEIRQKVTPFYTGQWNAVGKYGTGCVYERIRDNILELGGKIHLNSEITGIDASENTLERIRFSSREPIQLKFDDVVISTLPINLTARFLGYNSTLKFRGIRSIYLAYNRESVLPTGLHWLYYDSDRVLFNRVTESKKMSPFIGPQNKTYLTAEITYSKGDEIDSMDSDKLISTVCEQAQIARLGTRNDIYDAAINKEDFVYPLQYAGFQKDLAEVKAHVARYQQLYSIGTGGEFSYADSQVLFHKAFDTVEILCNKDSKYTQTIRKTKRAVPQDSMKIGSRVIAKGQPAFIIAEAGINHNGSLEMGLKLIDEAKKAGCDAIKFQTFGQNSRVSSKIKSVRYAETIVGQEETLHEMFSRLAMPFEDQRKLFDYAKKVDIEVFSTPFDVESVDFLDSLGVRVFKIASMDLVNLPLIEQVARKGKPIILSTGMSTLGQIEEAIDTIAQNGNSSIALLHCNSSYPAATGEMNLRAMESMRQAFNVPVGLSDHTFGLFVSHTAVAIGAQIIERHFTLDRTLEGPDHILSSDPIEMKKLVEIARQMPILLGDGVKRIQPSEYSTINTQRKSLYAKADIREGESITSDKIMVKGPAGGLLPRYLDIVVGRIARKNISAEFPITWNDI